MESSLHSAPAARRSARMLLAAWNAADLRQIQNAIEQASRIEPTSLRAADAERLEMIQEIAAVIRQWMAGHKSSSDLKASLDLLRHLANSDAFSAAPRSGMHVSGPH